MAVVATASALAATPAHERIERTLPFPAGGTLTFESYRGALVVEESERDEVRLSVDVEADAETPVAAERARANLSLDVAVTANGVKIAVKNRDSRVRFVWEEGGELDLVFRIAMPRRGQADLKVTDGSITVNHLAGRVRAAVEAGNIFLKRIEGAAEARATFGDVVISRCTGDVSVRVLRGLIRTGSIGGRADLRNDSGVVELMTAHGAVDVRAIAGDATVGFAHGVRQPSSILADGGNVRVSIDPAASCNVAASASWGKVRVTTLPLRITAGSSGAKRLEGMLNAGGPRIQVRADGGSVLLERGETNFELEGARPAAGL